MARILSIDYGAKRVGLAVTDELQIIASALDTVATDQIYIYLTQYLAENTVERFVLGLPKSLKNEDTDATPLVRNFSKKLEKKFPNIPISFVDERFTSKIADQAMVAGGMKKKHRRQKGNVDKISAVLILQSYLESNSMF